MSEKLNFEIIDNGRKLRVTPENMEDFKAFIAEHEDDALTSYTPNSDMAFMELTESYSGNGWGVFTGDQLNQMTQCLVIAEESTIEEDGSYTLHGKAWTNINDYQLVSPLYCILEDGHYDFELWEEFKGENFKA